MTQWETLVLDSGPGAGGYHALQQDKLNELGLDGWELVTIVATGEAFKVYLKRPLP